MGYYQRRIEHRYRIGVADDRGVILNLAQANVEVVYGGYCSDVFIGSGADETMPDANVWKNAA